MKSTLTKRAINETDAKRLLKIPEFRQGLMEGFRRGHERGVMMGKESVQSNHPISNAHVGTTERGRYDPDGGHRIHKQVKS